jgi:uncharacterized protein
MRKRLAQILIACFMAGVIAGCASSSPSRFYTLNSTLSPAAPPQTNVSVSVGPVSVPAAVDRPQIVVRSGPNMVSLAEVDRWASPLKGDIARVVAENLVSMLGTPQVTVFPQSMAAETAYRVGMDILRFESEPGKAATLDALWTVNSRKGGQSRSGRTTISEPVQGGGYAELVAAHSRALGQLSGEIAATIREMEAQKP